MLNKVILMGRLTRDPELRFTQSNIAVTSFSIAVDRNYKSRGEQQAATDFIDIVAMRGTAEFVSKWFSKGRMIVVVGSLQVRNWQDKDGNNRRTAEVVADEVYFGDSKRSGDDSGSRFTRTDADFGDQTGDRSFDSFSSSPYSSGLPVSDFEDITDDDDELPF